MHRSHFAHLVLAGTLAHAAALAAHHPTATSEPEPVDPNDLRDYRDEPVKAKPQRLVRAGPTEGDRQRIARAEAKRQRKAAKRLAERTRHD